MKWIVVYSIVSLVSGTIPNENVPKQEECSLTPDVVDDIAKYANITKVIVDYFVSGPYKGQTWSK
jgi:hypothetical protein